MLTENQYVKLVDYVADMRARLQRANTRYAGMFQGLELLQEARGSAVEVDLWKTVMREQASFIDTLEEQLSVYEALVGWR